MQFKPYEYQRYCINRVIEDKALGLLLEMGLGKTVIVLTAINDLIYNRLEPGRVLVIAPKKVAETTWTTEAAKWDHLKLLRVVTVLGTAKQRIRALNSPADIWVINRENVAWLVEKYRNCWPFATVIVDELTSFKSPKAQRFKSLTWVRPHIQRIIGLTGTPAPNGLIDLWAQVYLLDQGARLGKHIGVYRERYFNPDRRNREQVFSYKIKSGSDEAIRGLIGDICVSMKSEDYLELPELVSVTTPVMLDPAAEKAYKTMEKTMILEIPDGQIDAATAAALTIKLLQLCNGAVYDGGHVAHEVHTCKLEAFQELIEGLNGQAVLVFYAYRHDLERIHTALKGTGLRVRELRTPQDQTDWNAGEVDVLLAHPASAAYGLNLQQGGAHIIWFGLTYNLEQYQQANARLYRQGQTRPVVIHHLVTQGGVDEDVMRALADKGDTQEALMQALKARIQAVKGVSV